MNSWRYRQLHLCQYRKAGICIDSRRGGEGWDISRNVGYFIWVMLASRTSSRTTRKERERQYEREKERETNTG